MLKNIAKRMVRIHSTESIRIPRANDRRPRKSPDPTEAWSEMDNWQDIPEW